MRSKLCEAPRVFTQELRDAGYYVNWVNKTDFNFEPASAFADDRSEWVEQLRDQKLPENQPFFLYYNFGATHESTMWKASPDRWCAANDRLQNDWRLQPEDRPGPEAVRVPR